MVLDLTNPVFAHGQLYTSLSRVRQASDIRVLLATDDEDCRTINVVHHQLLLPSEPVLNNSGRPFLLQGPRTSLKDY